MPVLLVRRDKAEVLTNYRVKDTTLVVDEVFTEAVLLAGVGKQQQRVIIKKKES
jgi:type IV secretion system protein VirB9